MFLAREKKIHMSGKVSGSKKCLINLKEFHKRGKSVDILAHSE